MVNKLCFAQQLLRRLWRPAWICKGAQDPDRWPASHWVMELHWVLVYSSVRKTTAESIRVTVGSMFLGSSTKGDSVFPEMGQGVYFPMSIKFAGLELI
jgi:hypothetical protein